MPVKMKIEELLQFVQFTQDFQSVQRKVFAVDEDRFENDAEHSFQLALVAWYVCNGRGLALDTAKVMKYALIHDLPETLTGDSHFLDAEGRKDKEKREHAAIEQIVEDFPAWPEFGSTMAAYVVQEDAESRFVWALDKMLPLINIYLDRGRTWRRDGTNLAMLEDNKRPKVVVSPPVNEIFEQWLALVTPHPEFFPK